MEGAGDGGGVREMGLDEVIEYLADDELLEEMPLNLRIRKAILDTHERNKQQRQARMEVA
jgi:GTP-binding protein